MSCPNENGVSSLIKNELVGVFPMKVLNLTNFSISSSDFPSFTNSALASSSVLPKAKASVCAKKFANNFG